MKITAIDTAVLAVPLPRPIALQYPQHKLVVAEFSTDEGIKGLGYSPPRTRRLARQGRDPQIRAGMDWQVTRIVTS